MLWLFAPVDQLGSPNICLKIVYFRIFCREIVYNIHEGRLTTCTAQIFVQSTCILTVVLTLVLRTYKSFEQIPQAQCLT